MGKPNCPFLTYEGIKIPTVWCVDINRVIAICTYGDYPPLTIYIRYYSLGLLVYSTNSSCREYLNIPKF